VRSHDLAGIEGAIDVRIDDAGRALRDAPFRVRVVLRLDREEVTDHVDRRRERDADEPLRRQPAGGDRVRGDQLSRARRAR
jgi:hypothetical protein